MRRAAPRAFLIDFDGVLRHHDPAVPAAIENRYGLAAGALWAARFDPALLRPAVLGQLTDEEWLAAVAREVGSTEAVALWWSDRGQLDAAGLALVRELRAAGTPVALTTNATDRLAAELAGFGLADEFDAIVNSSVLGLAKPAAGYFVAACAALGTAPELCLLLDDGPRNVAGARAAGLLAHRYQGSADLDYVRAVLRR